MELKELRDACQSAIDLAEENKNLRCQIARQSRIIAALVTSNGGKIDCEVWYRIYTQEVFMPYNIRAVEGAVVVDVKQFTSAITEPESASMDNQKTQGAPTDVDSDSADRVVMPWDKRAIELEPIEGIYSHYVAWKEWFEAWNARQSSALELDLNELATIMLYTAFCDACSECSTSFYV